MSSPPTTPPRAGGDGGSVGSRSLGSTAIYGAVDVTVSLERRGDVRTISTEQRWGEPLPQTEWNFDPATGEITLDTKVSDRQAESVRERIVSALSSGQLTKKATQEEDW